MSLPSSKRFTARRHGCAGFGLLALLVAVAATVPVFTLSVARDLTRLPELVEQIFAWHDVGRLSPNAPNSSVPAMEHTHKASPTSYSGEVCS